ncbi:dicarboxylate/amino acid:cation symporter [Bordetella avium]|uniref:dicarboxylate/amino acid:cation symporter n=1 Tax=Bordetella avium TaxID=521 RepID=UPI0039FBB011
MTSTTLKKPSEGKRSASRLLKSIQAFSLNPLVVVLCLVIGAGAGAIWPAFGTKVGFVGDIYIDLLKMTTLPFMISAVIFSIQRLFRVGDAPLLFVRLIVMFLASMVLVALTGMVLMLLLTPGSDLPRSVLDALGSYVGTGGEAEVARVQLYGPDVVVAGPSLASMLGNLIPTNIFAALAAGDMLKALIFALLFGLAVGSVPERIASGLSAVLETIYYACQKIIHSLSLPLPLILLCMSASQMAKSGIEPILAMLWFLVAFGLASLLLMALAVVLVWQRSGGNLRATLLAMREPFSMAIATRNSAAAMPSMIEGLATGLGYSRFTVELLVPLSLSLLRLGPIVYYVCATLFIAQLYGVDPTPVQLLLVIFASMLAGLASAGSTGILTVSLIGIACGYLGLPFEAAFLLFLAIDPVCDMLRTLLLVIGNFAVVAGVCPKPLRI